jgi:hypothetical protein
MALTASANYIAMSGQCSAQRVPGHHRHRWVGDRDAISRDLFITRVNGPPADIPAFLNRADRRWPTGTRGPPILWSATTANI